MRELLAEALDELKAHLLIMRSEPTAYEWSKQLKTWCKWCKCYGKHSPDCIISRIERALETKP